MNKRTYIQNILTRRNTYKNILTHTNTCDINTDTKFLTTSAVVLDSFGGYHRELNKEFAMKPSEGGFRLWTVGGRFALSLSLLVSSFLLRQTSPTSTAHDGTDVTPSTEVSERAHYRSGGGIVQPLRIAAVEMDPFFSKQWTPSGEGYSGYLVDVVEEMSRIIPFQFEWVVVDKEEANGSRRKNGNRWTELTGKLLNGMANVSVLSVESAANHLQNRRFVITQPFLKSTLSLLVRAGNFPSDTPRPLQLENLLNVSNQSRLGFSVTSEAVAHQLRTYNSSLYQQIWGDRSPSEVVVPLEEGLRKVRQGNFVLLVESTEAVYYSSREPCDLLAHDQFIHETGFVFATRRNASLLVGLLNDAIDRLREGDFFPDLYRKWWDTDECGRGETGRDDDRDLDMERIFFTSPIKFFKPQEDVGGSPRSGSFVTVQSIQPEVDRRDRPDTVSRRPDSMEGFRWNTIVERTTRAADVEWHRKRDRVTHPPPPHPTQPEDPGFEAGVQTDSEFSRRSQRRSRRPKQTLTTVPLRSQGASSRISPRVDIEAQSPVPRTERTRESPSRAREWSEVSVNDGRDVAVQSSRHQKAGYTIATPVPPRTTKSSRDFARDFDWVFVTEQPRLEDEFDYESDDYDDDDDVYHEQRMTVKVVGTKPKDPVRVSSNKDTVAKPDPKSSRNSSGNSSSCRNELERSVLILIVASVCLQMSIRFPH